MSVLLVNHSDENAVWTLAIRKFTALKAARFSLAQLGTGKVSMYTRLGCT